VRVGYSALCVQVCVPYCAGGSNLTFHPSHPGPAFTGCDLIQHSTCISAQIQMSSVQEPSPYPNMFAVSRPLCAQLSSIKRQDLFPCSVVSSCSVSAEIVFFNTSETSYTPPPSSITHHDIRLPRHPFHYLTKASTCLLDPYPRAERTCTQMLELARSDREILPTPTRRLSQCKRPPELYQYVANDKPESNMSTSP
jgi:hypothetical protein